MSLIYMTNTTPVDVAAGGRLPISVARRTGCAIQNGDNSVILKKPSYYTVNATVSFVGQTAGDVTLELQKNDVVVPGITSSVTVATPDTDIYNLTLTGVIRLLCYEGDAILTLVNNSDVALSISNIALQIYD